MTLLVGIRCTDGVVVATDAAATFGVTGRYTITHPLIKIDIIDDAVIVATTGQVGLGQRFREIVGELYRSKELKGSPISWAKTMCTKTLQDFASTGLNAGGLGALVAFSQKREQFLCEFQ